MDTQKSSSKLSATLLALILGASVFMAGQVWAAKYVTDPTTGKVVVAPQYGGTLTAAHTQAGSTGAPNDPYFGNPWGPGAAVNERLGIGNWGIDRDVFDFKAVYLPLSSLTGRLAESWDISPDGLTYTFNIRKGVNWQDKAPTAILIMTN